MFPLCLLGKRAQPARLDYDCISKKPLSLELSKVATSHENSCPATTFRPRIKQTASSSRVEQTKAIKTFLWDILCATKASVKL